MSICLLQNDLHHNCINSNILITEDLLDLFDSRSPKLNSSNIKFCSSTDHCSIRQYVEYVERRRECKVWCSRDCEEENYDIITESNVLSDVSQFNVSYVTIKPDRNFLQRIEHNSDMDLYQFIGNLYVSKTFSNRASKNRFNLRFLRPVSFLAQNGLVLIWWQSIVCV